MSAAGHIWRPQETTIYVLDVGLGLMILETQVVVVGLLILPTYVGIIGLMILVIHFEIVG